MSKNTINENAKNTGRPFQGARRGGFGPRPGMGVPVEKAKDFKGTIKKLTGHLSRYKWGFMISFIFAIGSTIFSIISPTILGNAVT